MIFDNITINAEFNGNRDENHLVSNTSSKNYVTFINNPVFYDKNENYLYARWCFLKQTEITNDGDLSLPDFKLFTGVLGGYV